MSAYEDVVVDLTHRIQRGEFGDTGRLPTMVSLAAHYHVGRTTLATALKVLEERGLIYGVQGVGLFVGRPERTTERPGGMFVSPG